MAFLGWIHVASHWTVKGFNKVFIVRKWPIQPKMKINIKLINSFIKLYKNPVLKS